MTVDIDKKIDAMTPLAKERKDVTHALLAVGGSQDVVDAGQDRGDVFDVAAVVPGGLDLVGAEHDLLETAHHHGLVRLQPRKPRHPRVGLGLKEEAGKQGKKNNNLHGQLCKS